MDMTNLLSILVATIFVAIAHLIFGVGSTFNGASSELRLSASLERNGTSRNSNATHYVYELATPEQAAANLQNESWVERLRIRELPSNHGGRIVEWSVVPAKANSAEVVDIFLKPFPRRSAQLIDLFLHGQVVRAMGENVVMLGWAKAALALGCRRVLMFDSKRDFIEHVDERARQVYIVDFLSLPQLKDALLVDDALARRTWELAYWGRKNETIRHAKGLNLPPKYTFTSDHSLVPFNYSNIPVENVRVGVLPTAITMNHVRRETGTTAQYHCDAFFMGKAEDQVENFRPLIKSIEEKILAITVEHNVSVNLCTGVKMSENNTLDEYLGFLAPHTINLGRTPPEVFADILGSASVVIGSGKPPASPTIIDTIFGGGVFMAPGKQFRKKSLKMEYHPLFIKTGDAFSSMEEQADEIIRLVLDSYKKQPFGGYNVDSYSVEHVCRQVLRFIEASFSSFHG